MSARGRRYGTPRPPLADRHVLGMRVPRDRRELRSLFRSAAVWSRIGLGVGIIGLLFASCSGAFTSHKLPPLDQPGPEISARVLTFTAPANWALIDSLDLLKRPIYLLAPQLNSAEPPTTISVAVLDVTADATATLGKSLEMSQAKLEQIVQLWATKAKRGPYVSSQLVRYNVGPKSVLVPIALLVHWKESVPWSPLTVVAPSVPPATIDPNATFDLLATPGPTPGPTPTPVPTPTPAPTSSVPGPPLAMVQWFALPGSSFYREGNRVRALVITLSYPLLRSDEERLAFGRAFSLLTDSILVR